ncbi:S9 family peptidase [bacterium]|nr:S9 family peptidase [bacterium]
MLFLLCVSGIFAQDASMLTLERIYGSDEFKPKFFGHSKWLKDGSGYATLEPSASSAGGRDIVTYDVEKGTREILLSSSRLIPKGQSTALSIYNYSWSPDDKRLLIFTNTQKVWRLHTRGDYWTLDLTSGELRQLGGDAKPSTLMFAKFSPDGKKVGYVRENNLYSEDVVTGKITQLTFDGSTTVINGTFDWVYEEEFHIRDGFCWSPDSKSIAYWQLDATGIGIFYMINNTDSVYSRVIPVQYPKAGENNSACRIGVISADGGSTTWMKFEGDSRTEYYIPRMEWAGNSDAVVMRHLNRLQNTMQLMFGSAKTGEVRTLFTDTDSAWVGIDDEFKVLEGGKGFLVISERDGWRHVYQVSRDGKNLTLLTPGNFDVVNVLNADEKENWLYYIASPDNATQRFLFRMKMDGKGKAEKLTPMKNGWHAYQISPNAKYAIHTYSTIDEPATIELINLPKHKTLRVIQDNAEMKKNLSAIKRRPTEFFKIDIGKNLTLDGWMIKPFDFDSTKKYPIFFFVYGEPANQTVTDDWDKDYLWHQMLAQQGYIVCSVDNRGAPAPRGRSWRKSIYRDLGYLGPQDQADAVRKLRTWNFIDSTRVGIWGWSGGGASTLQAMFRFPELYHVGMCISPVTDQHNYDNIYTERYMGLPKDNGADYHRTAPLTYAKNLRGHLLLVHGTGDDNVHYQNTEMLINTLIKEGKQFEMMAYPNRTHSINEGAGTSLHLRTLLTRYLKTHLPAGPK